MALSIGRYFTFTLDQLGGLTLSDSTKIHVSDSAGGIELRKQTSGFYPLDANLFVRGPLVNPEALISWISLWPMVREPKVEGTTVGTVRYRLNDGTNDFWWNGAAWAAPAAGEWNTLATIQARLGQFPTASKKLRVVFGLTTTNKKYTPLVRNLSLVYTTQAVSAEEEALLRTLVPEIRDNVLPLRDASYTWPGGSTFDLDTTSLEEPVKTVAVVAAFNQTDDPELRADLLQGYDSGTHVVTLTGSLAAGKRAVLRHSYKPLVAIAGHGDFDEIATVPAVLLADLKQNLVAHPVAKTTTYNVNDATTKSVHAPRQTKIRITLRFLAARLTDLFRLSSAVQAHLIRNSNFRIRSLDTRFAVVVEGDPSMAPRTDAAHTLESSLVVTLNFLEGWHHQIESGHGAQTVNLGGDMNAVIE